MPAHPPPTPWLPTSRFADESLLLTTQPIFGDVSLGEESDWSQVDENELERSSPGPSSSSLPHQLIGSDMTLDLRAYLPEDADYARTTLAREGNDPMSKSMVDEATLSTGSRVAHKRDGSVSLLAGIPSKKLKPPIAVGERDDLYSRRLSDSSRSSLSPMLLSLTLPTPPSFLSGSSSSSSGSSSGYSASCSHLRGGSSQPLLRPNTASARLKESIRRPEDDLNGKQKDMGKEGQDPDGRENMQTSSTSRTSPRPTPTVSRHLAKSTIPNPMKITPVTPTFLPPAILGADFSLPSLPSATPGAAFTPPDFRCQAQLANTTSAAEETPTVAASNLHSGSSPRVVAGSISDDSSAAITLPCSPTPTDSTTTGDPSVSRRSSMSGKVVDFLTGLVRSVSSSSLRSEGVRKQDKIQLEGLPRSFDDMIMQDSTTQADTKAGSSARVQEKSIPPKAKQAHTRVVPLTKPIPFSRQSHSTKPTKEPLQPTRVQPTASRPQSNGKPSVKPVAHPATSSAFASAALARLPAPGKGASSAAKPVEVKPIERARDLGARRGVFERLSGASQPLAQTGSIASAGPGKPRSAGLTRTVPLTGQTPGKASQLRAQQRSKFDAATRDRLEEKERVARGRARQRELEEEELYKKSRKETVIWARPVPSMYRRQAN